MRTGFIISACLLAAFTSIAEDTNELFLTEPAPSVHYEFRSHEALLHEAKTNRESLPAKDFPEGNWGKVAGGLQLSLRFDKRIYTNGETITAIMLARNITNHELDLDDVLPHASGNPIVGIFLTNLDGQHVVTWYEGRVKNLKPGEVAWATSGGGPRIYPQTQMKALESLKDFYILTNGTYLAHAYSRVGHFEIVNGKFTSEPADVKSADVRIKIEDSPSGSK